MPRSDCEVLAGADAASASVVGVVTSGSFSASLGAGIALWRLQAAALEAVEGGSPLFVQVRQRRLRARLTSPPFVRSGD